MLRLPVAVLMRNVRRTHGHADGEERQQRGDEISARVQRLRDEPEAVHRETGRELDRQQHHRGDDGHERGSALRAHMGRLTSEQNGESPQKRALAVVPEAKATSCSRCRR